MEAAIGALPRDAAFINLCYDRRTSFFATCLGSKLVRSGRTYLGRYTTPYEFPHNWEALVQERTAALASAGGGFLGFLSRPIQGLLSRSIGVAGSAALGLLLMVLALRAILLPLSFPAQRAAFRSRRAAAAIASVRERFAGDAAARKRALRETYRAHGIRPLVTVSSIALQLLVLIAAFQVVTEFKAFRGAGFVPGWVEDLSAPDRTWVLPGFVGLAAAGLMSVGGQGRRVSRLAIAAATGILLAILVAPLRSAVGLFLAASVGFAVLEKSVAFALERRRLGRIHPPSPEPSGGPAREPQVEFLPLARAATAEGVGGKARNLAQLKEAGFPVPDGFVLPPSFFGESAPSPWIANEAQLRALRDAFRALGSPRVA
ncbi:MAG: YidC/Oxa1 family membrane protein insertase, partial [Gaiellaceae bacterium]